MIKFLPGTSAPLCWRLILWVLAPAITYLTVMPVAAKPAVRLTSYQRCMEKSQYLKEDKRFGSYLFTVRAVTLRRKNDFDGAKEMLMKALAFDKTNALAYFERGKLLLQLNDPSKAKEDFIVALKLGDHRATNYLTKIGSGSDSKEN